MVFFPTKSKRSKTNHFIAFASGARKQTILCKAIYSFINYITPTFVSFVERPVLFTALLG